MSEGGKPGPSLNSSLTETAETVRFYFGSAIKDSVDTDRRVFPFKVEFSNIFINIFITIQF